MPSGFRVDTDGWIKEYEESRELAQEIVQLIQDRNINNASGGPEASRKTAAARRKIGTLGTQLEKLLKWLDTPEAAQLSELEKNRRRDLLYDLKGRREQMQFSLKRQHGDKDALFEGNGNGRNGAAAASAPQETERTAELDARGLLQLHTTIMKQQDEELEEMEKSVANTKHVALAIGEEVDLQTRLLDELDEDVDVTHTRMRAATAKVRQILRRSSNWKAGFCIFLLIVVLVFVVIVALKLQRLVIG